MLTGRTATTVPVRNAALNGAGWDVAGTVAAGPGEQPAKIAVLSQPAAKPRAGLRQNPISNAPNRTWFVYPDPFSADRHGLTTII